MLKYNKIINYIKLYKHGYQPEKLGIIKLNSNENPFNPAIKLIKNLLKEIKFFGNLLKFYPESESIKIKWILSKYYNLKLNQIFIGNGSDEILAHSFFIFLKNEKNLYIQDITYSFYESYIKLYKINYILIRLNKNFSTKINSIKFNSDNILITNPNAPTGKLINNILIENLIINNNKSLILLDEAYIDFKNKSSISLIKNYKNILIIQTLSKSRSLAGLRLGFAFGNNLLIKKLSLIKNSFNTYPINILTQKLIKSIYINNIYFTKNINKLLKLKNFLVKNLIKLNFKVIKSKTNFLLCINKNINSNNILKNLKQSNIFVRKFEIPKLENYLRITLGSKLNCKILINNLKRLIYFK